MCISAVSSLRRGENLPLGAQITSDDGKFSFVMQTDGNMVIYDNDGVVNWSAGAQNAGAGKCSSHSFSFLCTEKKIRIHVKNVQIKQK